jgi:hypothetical protein
LRRRYQYVRLLRLEAHGLHGVHHVFRLIEIRVAKLRHPRRVLCEIIELCGKRRQALNGRIPSHTVRQGRPLIRGQSQVLSRPGIRQGHLVRIGGGNQYLSHQGIRVKSKRRYQLIQLVRNQRDVRGRRDLLVAKQIRSCRWNDQYR